MDAPLLKTKGQSVLFYQLVILETVFGSRGVCAGLSWAALLSRDFIACRAMFNLVGDGDMT
jgi:hypothetical protein